MVERDAAARVFAGQLDYVQFTAAGDRADGEYRCAECGYGVTVWTTLPRCPMCSGKSWERSGWGGLDGDRS
jgi:rubrerythrin